MNRSTISTIVLALALGGLWACSPSPQSTAPAPQAAAAPPPPAVPPPPARKTTMICRNSQNGLKVECGTPNAVMVGMKTE